MQQRTIIQSREITEEDIKFIQDLISKNSSWNQSKISQEICRQWLWFNDKGQIKDIACRSLLRKLESRGYIKLPKPRRNSTGRMTPKQNRQAPLFAISSAHSLAEAQPILIENVASRSINGQILAWLLSEYHYLGYKGSVGENLLYLIKDNQAGVLGCVVFGAAAWKTAPRDQYIGWQDEQRQRNLKLIANNMRFLLLSKVLHLASHILGQIAKRISHDWQEKYGHPIIMLETFVEVDRFKGTCYRAANWVNVGETQGRSRNDRYSKLQVPVKHIYVYPLDKGFKEKLCV